jgi:hypothetical protein
MWLGGRRSSAPGRSSTAPRRAADRAVEEARERYRKGAQTMRIVRVTDPERLLRIIDFADDALLEMPE